MDDRGNIRNFDSDEHAKREGFIPLKQKEVDHLQHVPLENRMRELELLRFMEHPARRNLGEILKDRLENAFRMGWEARK